MAVVVEQFGGAKELIFAEKGAAGVLGGFEECGDETVMAGEPMDDV